MSISPSNISGL